jgi:NO-binding membrane sensor protein with MHYT domain
MLNIVIFLLRLAGHCGIWAFHPVCGFMLAFLLFCYMLYELWVHCVSVCFVVLCYSLFSYYSACSFRSDLIMLGVVPEAQTCSKIIVYLHYITLHSLDLK